MFMFTIVKFQTVSAPCSSGLPTRRFLAKCLSTGILQAFYAFLEHYSRCCPCGEQLRKGQVVEESDYK